MDFTPRPITCLAFIQEAKQIPGNDKRGALYSVTLNTPYMGVGGMLNGPEASKIYDQAQNVLRTGSAACTVELMPVSQPRGNEKGFVTHMHRLEIVKISPAAAPATSLPEPSRSRSSSLSS